MTVPVKQPVGDVMESVIIKGDLGKLTPDERVRYYNDVCKSMGLNPLTRPFDYIVLNGKMQLYALRACADQLRKINSVSLEIVSREVANDVLTIHVRASLPDGRKDEDLGAVAFPETLKGENRVNAELKAVTKAKRRATLSICGLGWLDETEVESIPASAKRPAPPAPNVMLPAHDAKTGELIEAGGSPSQVPPTAAVQGSAMGSEPPDAEPEVSGSVASIIEQTKKYDADLAVAAETGDLDKLRAAYKTMPKQYQDTLLSAVERRHKPRCIEVAADLLAR